MAVRIWETVLDAARSTVDVSSQDPDKVEMSSMDVAELLKEDELKVMVSARPCAEGFLGRVHLIFLFQTS